MGDQRTFRAKLTHVGDDYFALFNASANCKARSLSFERPDLFEQDVFTKTLAEPMPQDIADSIARGDAGKAMLGLLCGS